MKIPSYLVVKQYPTLHKIWKNTGQCIFYAVSHLAIKIEGMKGEEEVNETFPMLLLFFQQ